MGSSVEYEVVAAASALDSRSLFPRAPRGGQRTFTHTKERSDEGGDKKKKEKKGGGWKYGKEEEEGMTIPKGLLPSAFCATYISMERGTHAHGKRRRFVLSVFKVSAF